METLARRPPPKRRRRVPRSPRPLNQVCGKYACVRYSTSDFIREKRRELAREA